MGKFPRHKNVLDCYVQRQPEIFFRPHKCLADFASVALRKMLQVLRRSAGDFKQNLYIQRTF